MKGEGRGLAGADFPLFSPFAGGRKKAFHRPRAALCGAARAGEKGRQSHGAVPTIPEKGVLENGKFHRRRGENPSDLVGFRQIARNAGRGPPRKTAKKRGLPPLHFEAMQALKLRRSLHNIHIPPGCRRLQIPVFHRFNLFSTERFHTFHRVFH